MLLAGALGLSGCSSEAEAPSPKDTESQAQSAEENPAAEDQAQDGADAPNPAKVLPDETDVPSGFRMLPATCEDGRPDDPDRTSQSNDDTVEGEEPDYSTWITYAVPDTWRSAGRSRGGSGGVTGSDEDLTFGLDGSDGSRGRVKVSVNWDSKDFEGTITDNSGEPWESFDHDSSVGDDSTTITYNNVATVQAGDQEADLFYMDQSQAPNHVSSTKYKMRLTAFELPHRNADGEYELMAESFVATFEFDQKDAPLDQETVESIAGSFALPECSYDHALESAELILGLDLNNDGHIRDAEDVQEELEKMLEELEVEMEKELQDSDEG